MCEKSHVPSYILRAKKTRDPDTSHIWTDSDAPRKLFLEGRISLISGDRQQKGRM